MKKIYINLLAILVLVSFVSAATIGLTALQPVVFSPGEKQKPEVIEDTISFKCDGKDMTIESTEPDNKWDDNDLRSAIGKHCSETVTQIQMNGLTYKQNKYGTKSFDETYLKKDECQKDENYFWNNDCNDISEEEDCTNHGKFWYDDKCNDKEQVFEEPGQGEL